MPCATGGLAWWVAGDHGARFASTDEGRTWGDCSPPGETRNLYALDFYDTSSGVAVGMNGMAYATTDGGQSWREVSCGLDVMLADVLALDARRAVVVGEDGLVLELRY